MAKPFFKTPGGKAQLLPQLLPMVPNRFKRYFEPFVGGGAMFFAMEERGMLDGKGVYLSDANADVVAAYKEVQGNLPALQKALERMVYEASTAENGRVNGLHDFYYKLRSAEPSSSLQTAARFLYLNKTTINGLIRYNKDGKFNAPIGVNNKGTYILPTWDFEEMAKASQALQYADVTSCHWVHRVQRMEKGDLGYFDPPYTGGFVGYTPDGWTSEDDRMLLMEGLQALRRGASIMLSTGTTSEEPRQLVEDIWRAENYKSIELKARRSVNSDKHNRGAVKELLFLAGPAF
jgi:DNA adenine methylase